MTQERWNEVKSMIRTQFEVVDEYEEDLDPGTAEVVECESPLGLLKISFIERPRVIGKKTLYAHRGSADVKVDYEYDPDDITAHLEVARWDDATETWREIDAGSVF